MKQVFAFVLCCKPYFQRGLASCYSTFRTTSLQTSHHRLVYLALFKYIHTCMYNRVYINNIIRNFIQKHDKQKIIHTYVCAYEKTLLISSCLIIYEEKTTKNKTKTSIIFDEITQYLLTTFLFF